MAEKGASVPEKVGDRVVCPDGTKGVIAFVHPTIPGAVFVQPELHVVDQEHVIGSVSLFEALDVPDFQVHMRKDLILDAD